MARSGRFGEPSPGAPKTPPASPTVGGVILAPSLLRRFLAIAAAAALLLTACGGSDGDDEATDQTADVGDDVESVDETPAATAIPVPSSTAVVIPTSTPLPTATPLPTSTPIPLEAPTPSAILLGSAFTNDSKVTTVGIDEVFFGESMFSRAPDASKLCLKHLAGSGRYRLIDCQLPTDHLHSLGAREIDRDAFETALARWTRVEPGSI